MKVFGNSIKKVREVQQAHPQRSGNEHVRELPLTEPQRSDEHVHKLPPTWGRRRLAGSCLRAVATALAISFLLFPRSACAELMDGDLAEEQAKEKEELRDMRNELSDINATVNEAMGELSQLGRKMATQQNAKEFHLFARESEWETYSGSKIKCLTYNGKIPGPGITVSEGDFVKIVLHNQMKTPTSLQFHGLIVPHAVGGVPRAGQGLVAPGQSFSFQFIARQAGTFWYHPQLVHPNQKQLGLYGAIVVQPKLRSKPVDKDITLFFSEIRKTPSKGDTTSGAAKKVTALKVEKPAGGKVPPSTPLADTAGLEVPPAYTAMAWTDGANPPDVVETDYLINGKAAPHIPAIELRKGERVKLRLINAGQEAVPIQLGGHRMQIVSFNGGDRLEPHVYRDTLNLNPSDRVDVEFTADNPGVWSLASEIAHQSTRKGKFPGGMACVIRYSEHKARPQGQPQQAESID